MKSKLQTKIVLIAPPIEDFYDTDIRHQPISLALLKASIIKYLSGLESDLKIDVVIRDYHHGYPKKTIPYPKEFLYLKKYYQERDQSPFSTFNQYYRFGADLKVIIDDLKSLNANIVGISSSFSPYHREVLELVKEIKKHFPDVITVIGGAHVTARPLQILKSEHDYVDFIIRGEGERAFVEFLKVVVNLETDTLQLKMIPNLGFRDKDKKDKKDKDSIILNPITPNFSLDEIPFANLDDLPVNKYLYQKKPLITLITSRSCPYHCSFCSIKDVFGENYRRRSVEDIFKEIKLRYQQGYLVFNFEDDNLTYNKSEFIQLCNLITNYFTIENAGSIPMHEFMAMNGVAYFNLDKEILMYMRKAFFKHLNLSLVSSNQQILKKYHRPHNLENFKRVVDEAFELGFEIVCYIIIGLPGEEISSILESIKLLTISPLLIGASIFYLNPGSAIGRETDTDLDTDTGFESRSTSLQFETSILSRNQMHTLFIAVRIINFIKGLKIDREKETKLSVLLTTKNYYADPRANIGFKILDKLFSEKKMYLYNKNTLSLRDNFCILTFSKLWNEIEFVQTQSGLKVINDLMI
ncbi:MAG: B12-binding domain-containing radical SAM protein [Oligoflexia bacterium]|nr:B12-binding domain-containing radical SAM protein [Oligoflexia bacterium]